MRGDIVYRVYGMHRGQAHDTFLGAFRTRAEAEARIAELRTCRTGEGESYAERYHNQGFVVREVAVATDFVVPARPKPRDKYLARHAPDSAPPRADGMLTVEVFRRGSDPASLEKIFEYGRDYDLLQTFEPFRQGDREFALISRLYTTSAVVDLASGKIIAEETDPDGTGFCPVGFWVPDWWDLHDGHTIPGSEYWTDDDEWPVGDFGFVWGCHWGDDNSWKVQYLDLSRVQEGRLTREERFGYVELATAGYESPCVRPPEAGPSGSSAPPSFITLRRRNGIVRATFAVEMEFELGTGKNLDWRRVKRDG